MKLVNDAKALKVKEWKTFVNKHPFGNIFQTPEMYKVYEETVNFEPFIVAAIDENKSILGIILSVVQSEHRGLTGRFSKRAIIVGGPLVNSDTGILEFLLKAYNSFIRRKAIYSEFRNLWLWDNKALNVFSKHGFKFEDHLDIIHDLTLDPEQQYSKIHKGRRKNINRALRIGMSLNEVENEQELVNAINIIGKNYIKLRIPLPDKSLFFSAFRLLVPSQQARFFIASLEEEIIGVRFVLCYRGLIYDWYAGSQDEYLDKHPNDFLPWKVMEWGHNNGFKTFDFGGAGKPKVAYGVREFKLKFGGTLVNFGRFKRINNLFMYYLGIIGYKIYKSLRQ